VQPDLLASKIDNTEARSGLYTQKLYDMARPELDITVARTRYDPDLLEAELYDIVRATRTVNALSPSGVEPNG
jgi:hypothetical protein